MVSRGSACLRRLAGGRRGEIVGFSRFLANRRVTVERLTEGWGAAAREACAGRHVLAIQDTSEVNFQTPGKDRGLGEIGKGVGRGVLLHPMLAVDADDGGLLGLVAGRIWTRAGRVTTHHSKRLLADKESARWLDTAAAAKSVLGQAAMVTEVSDRESDIYAKWARVPETTFHILTRAMHNRSTMGGGTLATAALSEPDLAKVELPGRRMGGVGRPARTAHLATRFGEVVLTRPTGAIEKGLPKTVTVSLVEVTEVDPPAGEPPILWRLLTTHAVTDAVMARRVVGWYRRRWIIEQFFRTLKQQGLQLEDSQVETAERLIKLTAIAARAACVIMQLAQARDGVSGQNADIAFSPHEIVTLTALLPELEGKTALQKNPHPQGSLAWAAWIIAKLGGWDGYPKSKPPGPITFRHGLQYFQALAHGHRLRHV